MSATYDVALIGAGPTGLVMAALLGQAGVRTLLIERSPSTSTQPRAIVLDDEGARTLQAFGMADTVLSHCLPGTGAVYCAADGTAMATVGSGAEDFGFTKRNFIRQPHMERLLAESLAGFPSVDARFSTEASALRQTADAVHLTLTDHDGQRDVSARYVVACDGGRSDVRQALGISLDGSTFAEDWLVVDTEEDLDTGCHARFICDPARPTVIVPAPHGGRRYEFMLLPGEDRETMVQPETVIALLKPYRACTPAQINRATVYTFHARIADRWRDGRIFLAGDAAHLTPPFAGQGMNAGLRDASNLAWKLAGVVTETLSEAILDSYEQERRGPCWAMIALAMTIGDLVMPTQPDQIALRNGLLQLAERFPPAKQFLFEMRFKPRPKLDSGLFFPATDDDAPGALNGAMLPQPRVTTAGGASVRLDDLLGTGFALIAGDVVGEQALSTLDHPLWDQLSPTRLRLCWNDAPLDPTSPRVNRARPENAAVARPLRAHRDQILLVRPDRYVLGACNPQDLATFTASIAALLTPSKSQYTVKTRDVA